MPTDILYKLYDQIYKVYNTTDENRVVFYILFKGICIPLGIKNFRVKYV